MTLWTHTVFLNIIDILLVDIQQSIGTFTLPSTERNISKVTSTTILRVTMVEATVIYL